MQQKFTEEQYAKMLPKKQVGTAVIFFNRKGELLIIKPNYKDGWLVPGGSTDNNESPLSCATRETKEEIGLDVNDLQLVGVYYAPPKGFFSDSLKFVFFGGVLSKNQIFKIHLQSEELEKYDFVSPEKALSLLSPSLQKSIPPCLIALKDNNVAYIE